MIIFFQKKGFYKIIELDNNEENSSLLLTLSFGSGRQKAFLKKHNFCFFLSPCFRYRNIRNKVL